MIAELIADNSDLQEIASNTDCLLSVLAGFFIDKPNEDDEMINEQNIILYNTLRQVRNNDFSYCLNRYNNYFNIKSTGDPMCIKLNAKIRSLFPYLANHVARYIFCET